MKLKKLYSLLSASLVFVAISNLTSAQAASITFDFFSTSASGVRGKIVFDDSVTPVSYPEEISPNVGSYLNAIQSYSITNGTLSFSGTSNSGNGQINVYNNLIDLAVYDPFNKTFPGDGLEFALSDSSPNDNILYFRFLYPDSTVLTSLSLRDIFLQNAVASQTQEFSLPGDEFSTLFTLLVIRDSSSGLEIQDGTFYGSDFVTSTTVPEPLTIFGTATALACGVLFKRKSSKKTLS
jgi:hypothetical protein